MPRKRAGSITAAPTEQKSSKSVLIPYKVCASIENVKETETMMNVMTNAMQYLSEEQYSHECALRSFDDFVYPGLCMKALERLRS